MEKLRKHITSVIVFGINLILMGVGFLFIKQGDEAKKNNLADENMAEGTLTKSEVTAENIIENPVIPVAENVAREKVAPETKNIPSSTAPAVAKPKAAAVPAPAPAPKSSAKTKTS